MRLARFILKIVGASLAFAGAVCLAIGYWDKMMLCDGLGITLGEFFSTPEFDSLEQEIK